MAYVLHNAMCPASLKMLSEKDKVFKMYYDDHKSVREIARLYNTGNGVVQYFFKVHGKKLDNTYTKKPHRRTQHVHKNKDIIVDMFLNRNMTTIEIGEKFKVSPALISDVLHGENIDVGKFRRSVGYHHKNKHLLDNADKIVSMYVDDDMTLQKIGDAFHVSRGTIRKVLVDNGVRMRGIKNSVNNKCQKAFEDAEDIYDKHVNHKLTLQKLSDIYDVSETTIFRVVKYWRNEINDSNTCDTD